MATGQTLDLPYFLFSVTISMWSHPLTSIDLYMQLSLLPMATRTMWFSVAIFRPSEGERELDRPVTCSEDVEELSDCLCVCGGGGGVG